MTDAWQIMYCGGAPPVVKTLEGVSEKSGTSRAQEGELCLVSSYNDGGAGRRTHRALSVWAKRAHRGHVETSGAQAQLPRSTRTCEGEGWGAVCVGG